MFSIRFFHRNYKKWKHIPDWDIAVVELNQQIEFSDFISPICLPETNFKPQTGFNISISLHLSIFLSSGTLCEIIGFGRTSQDAASLNFLHEASIPIIGFQECDNRWYPGKITPRMLCAGYPQTGGVGICHVTSFS